jgi:hypothetical protein
MKARVLSEVSTKGILVDKAALGYVVLGVIWSYPVNGHPKMNSGKLPEWDRSSKTQGVTSHQEIHVHNMCLCVCLCDLDPLSAASSSS